MSTTPRPALVNICLTINACLLATKALSELFEYFSVTYFSVNELLSTNDMVFNLYVLALAAAILLSGLMSRRAGLAGALLARAGWIQGLAFAVVFSLFELSLYFEQRVSSSELVTILGATVIAAGFALALRFVEPITLDQTPLRIVPRRLRSPLALSTAMMLTELHFMLFYMLMDQRISAILLTLAVSIIASFVGIVRGLRWGFALHVANLAILSIMALAQLLGWETPIADVAPLLLISLGVQAIPYIAMLRGDLWLDASNPGQRPLRSAESGDPRDDDRLPHA